MNLNHTALIIATGDSQGFEQGLAGPLFPLVDRPFLQHVIEELVSNGFKKVHLAVHHQSSEIEFTIGDGERWGCEIKYHLIRDPEHPYRVLNRISLGEGDSLLMVHADRLCPVLWQEAKPARGENAVIYYSIEQSEKIWTGSAWLTPASLNSIPLDSRFEELASYLVQQSDSAARHVQIEPPLGSRTVFEILDSQLAVLNQLHPSLLRFFGSKLDGIWIGRNVLIHPTAEIVAPVFIGDNTEVERDCTIGPNAVIGADCHVHSKCHISNSAVHSGSMVGEGLSIEHCALDQQKLYNAQLQTLLTANDPLLLGSTKVVVPGFRVARRVISSILALFLFLLFSPVLAAVVLVQKLRCGTALVTDDMVQLPCDSRDPGRWKTFQKYRVPTRGDHSSSSFQHFLCCFVPGLLNVVKGEVSIVGCEALSKEELEGVPPDWREVIAGSRVGLISESTLVYGAGGTRDEVVTAEIYNAVAVKGLKARLVRIARYFVSLFFGTSAHRAEKRCMSTKLASAFFQTNKKHQSLS